MARTINIASWLLFPLACAAFCFGFVCLFNGVTRAQPSLPQQIFAVSNTATLRFSWRANSEIDLEGYLLRHRIPGLGYDFTVVVPRGTTNYSLSVQLTNLNYFSIMALSLGGLSDSTAELAFPEVLPELGTNYTLVIQSSPTVIGPWMDVSSNRIFPTNAELIYRALIFRHQ